MMTETTGHNMERRKPVAGKDSRASKANERLRPHVEDVGERAIVRLKMGQGCLPWNWGIGRALLFGMAGGEFSIRAGDYGY